EWLGTGPALVVVTRGGNGVFAVTGDLEVRRPATSIDLVDTVGAGDSFTSGLLDGLRRADLIGGAHRESLATIDESGGGSVMPTPSPIAAITCPRPGAAPPTRDEVEAAQASAAGSAPMTRPP